MKANDCSTSPASAISTLFSAKRATISPRIVNIDATIIAQAPKMAPHIASMVNNIAVDLGLPRGQVNIKATTTDGLGFTGRAEGIAAQAIVLLNWAV
jgi:2-C-methyl-D-erythritol 2,4-cyclodiphosphate synthase